MISLLERIHTANIEYYQKTKSFITGIYTSVNDLNSKLNLNLELEQVTFFWETQNFRQSSDVIFEFKENQNRFGVSAALTKPGTAFLRDSFTLLLTENPINLKHTPPNPCCIEAGMCPSL